MIQRLAVLTLLSLLGGASLASTSGPLPPPVAIKISQADLPNGRVGITVSVIPQEDMHLDVSCLIPAGVNVSFEKGFTLTPTNGGFMEAGSLPASEYFTSHLWFWAGRVEAGQERKFSFQVEISDGKRHELAVRAQALARWGTKYAVVDVLP